MDSNPTTDPHEDPDLTRPGHRTGRGAWSILPYLNQTLKARPKAEMPPAPGVEAPHSSDPRDKQP